MFLSVNKIIAFITLQTNFEIFDLILQVDLDSNNQVTTRATCVYFLLDHWCDTFNVMKVDTFIIWVKFL